MFDRVFDEKNRPAKLTAYRDTWLFTAGRCPFCKRQVAKACFRLTDYANIPDIPLADIACCKKFLPTVLAVVQDGSVVDAIPVGSLYLQEPDAIKCHADNWCQYVLWEASLELERNRLPFPENAAFACVSEWLKEMVHLVADPARYADFSLFYAQKVARQVEKYGLYKELWSMVPEIYGYVKKHNLPPAVAAALFALYRAIFRQLCGDGQVIVAVNSKGPVKLTVGTVGVRKSNASVRKAVWPYDTYAFNYNFVDPADEEFLCLDAGAFRLNVKAGENPYCACLQKIRAERRYTLTPGGVRAVLPAGYVGTREVLLKEQGDNTVAAKIVASEPGLSFLCWFNWETGVGFSPWQIANEYVPDRDPLLGLVAEVFCDLVTGSEKDVRKRIEEKIKTILLPGEEKIKTSRRVVYIGRNEESKNQIRKKLVVERKAPSPHAVAGHLRKARKASAEAIERARKHGIVVPDGYTFVSPYLKGRQKTN